MRFIKDKSNSLSFENIQSFLDNTRGQITIGEIPPISRAALAAQGEKARSLSSAVITNPSLNPRHTRNWTPIAAVTLNPERDSVVKTAVRPEIRSVWTNL
jgi:hypothetical protein